MKLFWFSAVLMGLISWGSASGFELLDFSVKYETNGVNFIPQSGNFLMVDLTLIQSAGAKGAGTNLSFYFLRFFFLQYTGSLIFLSEKWQEIR